MIKILTFRPEEKFRPVNMGDVTVDNVPLTKIVYNRIDVNELMKDMFDFAIFTSAAAVESVLSQFPDFKNELKKIRVIAIGNRTAEALGMDCIAPKIQSSRGILEVVGEKSNVLLIRSENGNPFLVKKLSEKSRKLTVINAYRSVLLDGDYSATFNALRDGNYSAVIFTSSMIFDSYIKIFSAYGNPLEILPGIIVAIGEETSRSMRKFNLNPVVMDVPDIEKSVEKVVSLLKKYG